MTLQNKKSIFNGYNISVILLVPVITFLTIGFDTGLFPKFWDTVYGGDISEENPYYFVFMHKNFGMVDMLDFNGMFMMRSLIPLLSGITVIPVIYKRDTLFQLEMPRLHHARRSEHHMIAKAVVMAGCVMYLGYVLTVVIGNCVFTHTYVDTGVNTFIENTRLPLNLTEHPYLYILLLGFIRFFLLSMLYALLTIAISYVISKVYIYLLLPTIYHLVAYSFFSQGTFEDKWPLPLFSPENFIQLKSEIYWGFGHDTACIWSLVCAAAIIILPSVVMIWYGMRRRRA